MGSFLGRNGINGAGPKKTEKAYTFTKAAPTNTNNGSGGGNGMRKTGLMNSDEKVRNSPGFKNKKKNFKA